MVQPMLALGIIKTPYFIGQNVLQFIEQYKRLYTQYCVMSEKKH